MEEKKRFSIPRQLRFPLIWTIFFAVIGIIIQSLDAKAIVEESMKIAASICIYTNDRIILEEL